MSGPLPRGASHSSGHCRDVSSRWAYNLGWADGTRLLLTKAAAQPMAKATAQARPGLYAVFGPAAAWRDLGLGTPLDDRPLYVGKAEDSLLTRDLGTHFASGSTGQSTLRRSLAALLSDHLRLVPMPRNPARQDYFANYGLEPEGDERLTTWMRNNLALAVWAPALPVSLDSVETDVLAALRPPLNLAKVATEWSATVSAARRRMARRAREWRGAR